MQDGRKAAFGPVRQHDAATKGFHDFLHDGQTKPGAVRSGTPPLGQIEPLPGCKLAQQAIRKPRSGVADTPYSDGITAHRMM